MEISIYYFLKAVVRIPVMANSDSEGSRTVIPDDAEQVSG
jgi:hypothetical protein